MIKLLRSSVLQICFFVFYTNLAYSQTGTSSCIGDTIRPFFEICPQNIVLTTNDTCAIAQWSPALAFDNCGIYKLIGSHESGMCFPRGITTVSYRAVDSSGNQSICSFKITVEQPNTDSLCRFDTIKPRFTYCPTNLTTTIASSDTCMPVQWHDITATDNCGTPTVTSSIRPGSCFGVGITPIVYTAVDAKGNSAICAFNINIVRSGVDSACLRDTVKPYFVNCPQSLTVMMPSTSLAVDSCMRVQWETITARDNCGTPSVRGTHDAGSCFRIGSTPVVYYALDARDNAATCSFTITVVRPNIDSVCANDTIKPRFVNCPVNNFIYTTSDTCKRVEWQTITAVDNCSTPSVTGSYQSGNCFPIGETPVVYYATDAKGNTTRCSFMVVINRPTTDSCLTDTIKPRFVNCPVNNFTYTISDTCKRVEWQTITAVDNCSTPSVTGSYSSGTCFKVGSTSVVYTAADAKGNVSVCTFVVIIINTCVIDTIKPRFISCPQNIVLNSSDTCARAQWGNPIATDNCGTPRVVGNYQSGFCFRKGTTGVVYTATDAKGNTSTCSFSVTVNNPCDTDTTKPRFRSCPQNVVINTLDTCAKAQWSNPTATDNCGTPSVKGNYPSGFCFKRGTTGVVYTATDAKGNTSICSFTITVKNPCENDTIKPIYYNCPANIVKETGDTSAKITWRAPTAVDNCSVRNKTVSHQSGSAFGLGTTRVVYAATDATGNTGYCSFTITVRQIITPCSVDTTNPVFSNCPQNISLTTAATSAVAVWTKPTATDNCSTPTVVSTTNPGANFHIGVTPVVYTATDAKRNVGYCSFSVTVTKEALVLDSTKCYILVARSSKKALSISNASVAGGADAVQWAYLGGLHQKWTIKSTDSNSVSLTVNHTNMNLDTRWGGLTNGLRLMQWAKSTTLTQKWQLIPLNDGYFKIINKGSGRALSVNGGVLATANGSLLVQSNYTGLTSQQWSIEAVPCGASNSPAQFTNNEVLDVNAKQEGNRARIEWVDNTGYKNDYYEVEKLNETSGKFESLTIRNNQVFDDQLTAQTVYDETPNKGDNFYRVKVVYLDSLTKLSPVQKVNFSSVQKVKIFPNPASDFIDVDLSNFSNDTAIHIDLYNSFGQKVATQVVQKGADTVVHFDISGQDSGNYLMRVVAQGKRDETQQIRIVR